MRTLAVMLCALSSTTAFAQATATANVTITPYAEFTVGRDATFAGLEASLPAAGVSEGRTTLRFSGVSLGLIADLSEVSGCVWSSSLDVASCSVGAGQGYVVKRGEAIEHWFANLKVRVRSYGDLRNYEIRVTDDTGSGGGELVHSGLQACAEAPHRTGLTGAAASAPLAFATVGASSRQERCIGFAQRFATLAGSHDFSKTVTFSIVVP